MTTLDKRLEARIDAETDEMIRRAAQLQRMTKSAFVLQSVRAEAERVLARGDVTLMSPELFDSLIDSLDTPDEAPGLTHKLADLPRLA